jgi:HAE1 family hydrophobic/amphiphilic exporter-1
MIRFLAAHPTAANLMMGLLILIGLLALPNLTRETFPRIAETEVEVRVAYPGASPREVSRELCRRLEDALDRVTALEEMRCDARENMAIAVAETSRSADFARFAADVATEVDAIDDFPDLAETPVIRPLGRTDFVASVALTGPEDPIALKALAEDLKEALLRAGAAPQVEVKGFSDPQIRIEARAEALRALGISPRDLATRIGAENVSLPAGEVISADGVTALRFDAGREAVDAFRDLVVAGTPGGALVRLGEIADIRLAFSDEEVAVFRDGRRAALLDVIKTPAEDTLEVLAAVEAQLAIERARAAPGVEMVVTDDRASIVRDRLSMLTGNGAQGLALVFAAMWLVFGLRQAFWIAMGLPVSFLGALAMMSWFGLTINMMTMVALIIVIGILMDDAIVISENIATHRARGEPPLAAAIGGAREVAPGVLSSFATTAVVFGSLIFLEGRIGEILGVVPLVMLLVLSVSLVEAFLILPNHLSHGGRYQGERRADRYIERLRRRAVGLTGWAVRFRWFALGLAVALMMAAVSLFAGGLLKLAPFPDIEGDQIEARLMLPPAATLAETERAVAAVTQALGRAAAATPDGPALVQSVVVRYNENRDAHVSGRHLATVSVDLLPSGDRETTLPELAAAWRAAVPGDLDLAQLSLVEPSVGPQGKDISVRLAHDDPEALREAAAALRVRFADFVGVTDLTLDSQWGKPELRVVPRPEAAALGLDAQSIARQLRTAFRGETADEVLIGEERFDLHLMLDAATRDALGDLADFEIAAPGGGRVRLSAVADIVETRDVTRIHRVDRRPTITVEGYVDPRQANAGEILSAVSRGFYPELRERFPDIAIGAEGAAAEGAKTQASMVGGLLTGLGAVYALLAFQFRSWREPVAVMTVIPFTVVGAAFGHLLMGVTFSLPSMLGVVSLAGVVVNGSILLIQDLKRRLPEAASLEEAATGAARARFRAILLTTVTTIAGVTPMLFETSLQAQVLKPLVVSIAFGLLASTVLLLLVVPALYAALGAGRGGKRPTAADETPGTDIAVANARDIRAPDRCAHRLRAASRGRRDDDGDSRPGGVSHRRGRRLRHVRHDAVRGAGCGDEGAARRCDDLDDDLCALGRLGADPGAADPVSRPAAPSALAALAVAAGARGAVRLRLFTVLHGVSIHGTGGG